MYPLQLSQLDVHRVLKPFPTVFFTADFFDCDFENIASASARCRVRQDTNDQFDWLRQSGKTPSGMRFDRRLNHLKYPVTGPLQAQSGSFYLYIEASGKPPNMAAW